MKRFGLFLLIGAVTVIAVLFLREKIPVEKSADFEETVTDTTLVGVEAAVKDAGEEEDRQCVWLSYSEIGSLVKGKSVEEYRESLEKVFENLKQGKINTVFYQCRAFCDSLYNSELFPVSRYLTEEDVALGYDPLGIFAEFARKENIELHCWINPYRVSYGKDVKALPKASPALDLYEKNSEALIVCQDGIYLNPAVPEVRETVLEGIREILENYNVNGIHFDDYFYPENIGTGDKVSYNSYKSDGGTLGLAQWRRENISSLVSSVYSLVKSFGAGLSFGVSPCADIEKCRDVFYADVESWCSEEGYIDYVIPQIYFGFENEKMPFERVAAQWANAVTEGNVKLICGLGAYKCGRNDKNAGKGKDEWKQNGDVLARQYEYIRSSSVYKGFSLFSYSYSFGENTNEISEKEIKNLLDMLD